MAEQVRLGVAELVDRSARRQAEDRITMNRFMSRRTGASWVCKCNQCLSIFGKRLKDDWPTSTCGASVLVGGGEGRGAGKMARRL